MFFRAAILSLIALAAGAQTPRPSFETASVKPNSDPDVRNGRFDFLPGGKLIVRNTRCSSSSQPHTTSRSSRRVSPAARTGKKPSSKDSTSTQ